MRFKGLVAAVTIAATAFVVSPRAEAQDYPTVEPALDYSIVETADPGYATTYDVSNDSPHTAITVADGEDVVVVVTNTAIPTPPGPPGPTPGAEGDPREIRWLRQTPILSNENQRMIHRSLTLDVEVGVGLREGQGVDPLVMLQYSNDSGHTWHNLHPTNMGRRGEYLFRVNWHRLGQSRNRLYRFYGSDPVKICLVDCYTEIERGDGS